MRKFFEKHDLFKLAGIFMLITIVLSWIISYSYYTEGTIASTEITRVGLFDISTYSQLGFYYFTVTLVFVFATAGFYGFLSNTAAYQKLTDNIAGIFKGKEGIFVALSTFIFACLSGVSTDYFVLFALIPFVITILAKMGVEKVVGLSATFGGVLVGVLGATYSTKIVGQLVSANTGLGVAYGFELITTIILFAIAYLLLTYFSLMRMKKGNKENLLIDPFAKVSLEETKKTSKNKEKKAPKVNVIPVAILLVLSFILVILAFIGWEEAFGVTVFSDVFNWVTEATLFDQTIFTYILGSSLQAFGSWDLLAVGCIYMLTTLIMKIIYRIPFDEVLDGYGEGFKRIAKSVVVLLAVYTVLELSIIYPTIPFFVDKILGLGTNVFTLFVSGALTSIFVPDFQFVLSLVGSVFKNFSNVNAAAVALQSAFGLIGFIAPTSLTLVLGLSMLDIKFKDWFKYIWKFVLALIVVICIVLAILMFV